MYTDVAIYVEYAETILIAVAQHEPNGMTLAAMKKAKSGILKHAPVLNLSSIDAMELFMGL